MSFTILFEDYGEQRNYALDTLTHSLRLGVLLDADERLSEVLSRY